MNPHNIGKSVKSIRKIKINTYRTVTEQYK